MKMYTEEQLMRCSHDAYSFYVAAKLMWQEIQQKKYRPNSNPWVSAMGILKCNLGMAFELSLKLLLIKNNRPVCHSHRFVKLFENLPHSVRKELEQTYQSNKTPGCIRAFIHTKTPEPPTEEPDNRPLNNLVRFFGWLDDMGMYDRRYAFEKFSRGKYYYYFDPPTVLFDLWREFAEYIGSFEK